MMTPENLRLALYGGVVVCGVIIVSEVFGHQPTPCYASPLNMEGQSSELQLEPDGWIFDWSVVEEHSAASVGDLAKATPAAISVEPDVASVRVVDAKQDYVPRHALADVLAPVFDLVTSIHI
jgi:hypothetical protein